MCSIQYLCTDCMLRVVLWFKIAAINWVPTMWRSRVYASCLLAMIEAIYTYSYCIANDSKVQRINQITWAHTADEGVGQTGNLSNRALDVISVKF